MRITFIHFTTEEVLAEVYSDFVPASMDRVVLDDIAGRDTWMRVYDREFYRANKIDDKLHARVYLAPVT